MRFGIGDVRRFPVPSAFCKNNQRNAHVLSKHGCGVEQPAPAAKSVTSRNIPASALLMILSTICVLLITSLAADIGFRKQSAAPRVDDPLQVRLGYPPDAKLLIINADDLGVAHSED